MNIKPIVIALLILVIGCYSSFSQNFDEDSKGDYYFEQKAFAKAIKYYETDYFENGNKDALVKLANCHRLLHHYEQAEKYYRKILSTPSLRNDSHYFYFAEMLKSNGKYNQYLKWIRKYADKLSQDSLNVHLVSSPTYFKELLENKGLYKIKAANFNTAFSEISPTYFNDSLITYSSNKHNFKLFGTKDGYTNETFYDMYFINPRTGQETPFKAYNTKYHDVAPSFSSDGTTVYFTRTDYYDHKLKTTDQNQSNLEIFEGKFVNNNWEKEQLVSFDNENFNMELPSVTNQGSTIFFASDIDGGYGKLDLYRVDKINGKWGNPVNLGPKINTAQNECFPFVHSDSILYFSSDGLPGLGGLDVFEAKIIDSEVKSVKNLGYPINEMKDDFAFIINTDLTAGYFSSDRPGGKGGDDIYSFTHINLKYHHHRIIGEIRNVLDSSLIAGAMVRHYDNFKHLLDTLQTGEDGTFEFDNETVGKYVIRVEAEGYKKAGKRIIIDPEHEEQVYEKHFYLNPIPVEKKIDPLDDSLQTANDTKELAANPTKKEAKSGLNGAGSISGKEVNISTTNNPELITTMRGVKIKKNNTITPPIFFEFNRADISTTSQSTLDSLARYLKKNPDLSVLINSHADCRGGDLYNEMLTMKRAQSTALYLASKGIQLGRLSMKGYGDTKPINDCDCQSQNFLSCTEAQYLQNRRTEFKFIYEEEDAVIE